jgi:hypothetical protein
MAMRARRRGRDGTSAPAYRAPAYRRAGESPALGFSSNRGTAAAMHEPFRSVQEILPAPRWWQIQLGFTAFFFFIFFFLVIFMATSI